MKMYHRLTSILLLFLGLSVSASYSQQTPQDTTDITPVQPKSEWYKNINIRGYAQLRYNRLLETNADLQCEQCDKSWGRNGGFSFRRIRIIFFGQVHKRMYFYIQPDFASSPGGSSNNFVQIRDAYFDVGLDKKNEFRFRFGQSKVPYGFENMQSSQNRLPLDRNDALNSAVANERDIGVFFYWAPQKIRDRFSYLVSSGLKGSGDYGVFGFGVYNGQTANRNEANDHPHVVARLTYPFELSNKQIIEAGIQTYTGRSVLPTISQGIVSVDKKFEFQDQRVAGTLVVYPQPFGIQAEYNVGTGPQYNPQNNTIEQKRLHGGYVMASYFLKASEQIFFPFVRYQYYNGGKKHELDARSYNVKEFEIGTEWQVNKNFELVAMYTISERRFEDAVKPVNFQKGSLLRLQAQLNF